MGKNSTQTPAEKLGMPLGVAGNGRTSAAGPNVIAFNRTKFRESIKQHREAFGLDASDPAFGKPDIEVLEQVIAILSDPVPLHAERIDAIAPLLAGLLKRKMAKKLAAADAKQS